MKIVSVPRLVDLIVLHQQLLSHHVFIELIWEDVWVSCILIVLIFFTDDRGLREDLREIILDCVLYMHVGKGEYIAAHYTFPHGCEALLLPSH